MTATRDAYPGRAQVQAGQPGMPASGQAAPGHRLIRQPSKGGARRLAANRTHRYRYQLRPWLVIAATAATALAVHAVPAIQSRAWLTLIPPAGMLAWAWLKHRRRRDHRVYAIACITVGGAWTWLVASYGAVHGPGRFAVLAVAVPGIFPLAWLWWQHHRGKHKAVATERPLVTEPAGPDPVITTYAENFAAKARRGEGTWLTGPVQIPAGKAYAVHLVPGKHVLEELLRQLPAISSALAPLGITRDQLVFEPMPGQDGEPGPDNLARLTVLERHRSPQREIQEFTGTTLISSTGLFADGPYPDGEMAMARLYKTDEHGQPIRTASGLYVGAQGSGKSRLVEHKTLEHMLSGIFLPWLIDGMGGSSMPGLLDHVDWPATEPEEWARVLKAAARLRIYRSRKQAARREGIWRPCEDGNGPFIQIVIDEAHRVLRIPECVRLVKMLLQEAEKTGIGVDLVTQVPLMSELGDQSGVGGGAHVIRGLAKDGNIAVFRTGDEWTKNVTIPGWEVDPRALPQRPGMHFLAAAALRQAPVRAIRAADPDAWARRAELPRLPEDEARACDGDTGDYRRRWQRFTDHFAKVEAGQFDAGDINAQLDAILGIHAVTPSSTGVPAQPGGRTAMSLCLEVLRKHGRLKRKQLIEEIRAMGHDYSESAIAQALRALATAGAITNKGGEHGEWTVTESRDATGDETEEPS